MSRRIPRTSPQRRTCLIVAGMHRSGTSAVSRTLSLLGAKLPSDLMPEGPDNPSGFWESAEAMRIHDHFLAEAGSGWDDPRPLPPEAFTGKAAAACQDELLALLHQDFADAPLFVLKDPRISRLLPLWTPVLQRFGAEPLAVLPVRNPLDVAMSLRLRNQISREKAHALWLVHMVLAERGTRPWRRIFVDYDQFLAEPEAQTLRLAEGLGCFEPQAVQTALPAITGFWAETLRHHHSAQQEPPLPGWLRQAYGWACKACLQPEDSNLEDLAQILDGLSEMFGPLLCPPAPILASEPAPEPQPQPEPQPDPRLGQLESALAAEQTRSAQAEFEAAQARRALESARIAWELARSEEHQETARRQAAWEQQAADFRLQSAKLTDSMESRLRQQETQLRQQEAQLREAQSALAAKERDLTEARQRQQEGEQAARIKLEQQQNALAWLERQQDETRRAQQAFAQQTRRLQDGLNKLAAIATSPLGQLPLKTRLGGLIRAAMRGRLARRLGEDRDIETVARSGLFDAAYYLSRYPDVARKGIDPLLHYVRSGAYEGRDPHPYFDSRQYQLAYPDVLQAGVNPLAHYARHGAAENRQPNSQGLPVEMAQSPLNPLLHLSLLGDEPLAAAQPVVIVSRPESPAAPLPVLASPAPLPAPIPAPILAPTPAQAHLPPDAFAWLAEDERAALTALLRRHGLIGDASLAEPLTAWRLATAFSSGKETPPDLSIIIPVHNQIRHTLAALESLALWPRRHSIEVLVGDDASTDATPTLLADIPGLTLVRHATANGFLGNCNRTAAQAKGKYLLFLNNDTVVLPGALDALLDSFAENPDAGLVGARLLYPDGRQQEAGGIIWADGSGWNYGRLDDPTRSVYGYLREADYVSGAALAIPAALWTQLGGFDSHFAPAYYEDTDLAFRVRQAGHRVLYQPDAGIIHFEGVSNGTSEDSGLKQHQRENRPKFQERWEAVLADHGHSEQGRPWNFAERSRKGRILVLDTTTPTPNRDSGSVDTVIMLRLLRQQGWHVTFVPENLLNEAPYSGQLRRLGIECLDRRHLPDFLSGVLTIARDYDAVLVSRLPLARQVMEPLRRAAPKAKLIFNTIDLHFLREEREAALFDDKAMAERAADSRKHELAAVAQADATLVVSEVEKNLLAELVPQARVAVMPLRREMPQGPFPGYAEREGVMFIGGFRHPPNQDAARWLMDEIWPLARKAGLNAPLYIVGPDAPPFLTSRPADNIHVLGHVADLAAQFAKVRLSIAPLRYGAGIKGKVIDSLSHGVPVVATNVAAEGIGLKHGRSVLLGNTPESLAQGLAALYGQQTLWEQIAKNGREIILDRFSDQAAGQVMADVFKEIEVPWY